MSSNQSIIITNSDDDAKAEVENRGLVGALAVEVVDASGTQITDFGGTSSSATVGDGTVTITTSGTAVQLSATSVVCKRVYVSAHESNSGTVLVGSSTVVANLTGRRGLPLFPTQGDFINVSNLNLVFVDSTSSGDIATFLYEI